MNNEQYNLWEKLKKLKKEYLKIGLHKAEDYRKSCMISVVYHSTKIENCSLTLKEITALVERDKISARKLFRDHLSAYDYYSALLFLEDQSKIKRKVSAEFVSEVHALSMKNTGMVKKTYLGKTDDSKGDFRLTPARMNKNKDYPDFKNVPALIEKVCNTTIEHINNIKGNDVLRLAADLHFRIISIHPFVSGNRRTSRLLMNYVQLYRDEPLTVIFTEDREKYVEAINRTEQTNDPEIFRSFICGQQMKFYEAEIRKITGKRR
ncbi:MAG: Fic family protein [Desulfobacterales bacterium]|nr:Fic family protein [Desulfobacterales bacterium]